jgi:hypothetical protein
MLYNKQKRLIITEQERNEILSKYGVINEVHTMINNYTLRVGSRGFFANGKWKNLKQEAQAEFDKDKEATKNFLREWGNIPGYIIEVKIEASESQVTNYDREIEGNVRLKKGELSRRRAATMKRILTQLFESYLKDGFIKEMPVFTESVIKIGETPYIRGTSDPKAAVYDKERYVTYTLKAIRERDAIIPRPKPTPTPNDCELTILFVSNANTLDKNRIVNYIPPDKQTFGDNCKAGWALCKGCSGRVGNENSKFTVYLGDDAIGTIKMDGAVGETVIGKVKITGEASNKLKNGPMPLKIVANQSDATFNFGFKIIKYDENNKGKIIYESCLPIDSYIITYFDYRSVLNKVRLGLNVNREISLGVIKDCSGAFELSNIKKTSFYAAENMGIDPYNPFLSEHVASNRDITECPRANELNKL